MNSPDTTARRSSTELDATDELPALDVAAYEAEVAAREATEPAASGVTATGSDGSAGEAPDNCEADAAPRVADADVMLEVEHWIVQKTEELRAQQSALRVAQLERTAGVARVDALSRELGATSANLEALNNRARILEDELTSEREAAQRRLAELDEAQREAARLGQELTAAHAAETRQSAALAASGALLQQRSEALEALQSTHAALVADRQRVADELSELESRLQDSAARERDARRTIEAQKHTHAELVQRTQDETHMRERLTAERELLQAQLASCVERLQNREAYRTIYESTIRELDRELAGATLRAEEQEARADQLAAELEVRERRLQDAARERDETRRSHDTAAAQQVIERGASEQTRSALESRLAELTTEHAGARARLLSMEATLTDTQRRAEDEALANGTAAERLREMEVEIASRQSELANARLEIARGRASLSDLTAALERSQTMLAEQSRRLEERESGARTMAASHAELVALIAALRGQIEELTARLATATEERRAPVERVAALAKEAAESDSRLARLESINVELRATVQRLHASLAERDAELQRATRVASTNAYALGRVQTSIDELGRDLTASEGAPAETQVSILTRIDGGQSHSFVLRARTTIGRDPDNDLSLAMGSVSRHHAVLIPAFRSALLQDLASTNGVLVNKRRVRCARLQHGDVITLGEAHFRYAVAPVQVGAVSGSQTPPRRRALR
jgi:chromosome segregation ATPase